MSLDISLRLNLWDWHLVTGLPRVKLLYLIVLREVPERLHVNFFLVYMVELIDSGTQNRPLMYAEWCESWLRNDPWHPSHCNIVPCALGTTKWCTCFILRQERLESHAYKGPIRADRKACCVYLFVFQLQWLKELISPNPLHTRWSCTSQGLLFFKSTVAVQFLPGADSLALPWLPLFADYLWKKPFTLVNVKVSANCPCHPSLWQKVRAKLSSNGQRQTKQSWT